MICQGHTGNQWQSEDSGILILSTCANDEIVMRLVQRKLNGVWKTQKNLKQVLCSEAAERGE